MHDSGVFSAGLMIAGQPAATAGPTWWTIRFSGWLKAEKPSTTPIGYLRVKARWRAEAAFRFIGISRPASVRSTSTQLCMPSMARATSTRESTSGLPPSRAASTASSSLRAAISAAVCCSTSMRCAGGSQRDLS